MTRPQTQAISPLFIVSNVDQTIAFYRDKLGFETRFQRPDRNPFFAIVGRDGVQIFVKSAIKELFASARSSSSTQNGRVAHFSKYRHCGCPISRALCEKWAAPQSEEKGLDFRAWLK